MARAMAAWAKGRFGDQLEHCRQYAKQTKIDMAAAMALFGLEEPQIPEGFEFVWEWFFELAQARTSSGFGWNPITWADMEAWARLAGVETQPWLLKCFAAMDNEWLKASAEAAKRPAAKEKK